MKKSFLLLLILTISILAEEFTANKVCKACHPLIYKEYVSSMHFKSTIFRDKIHSKIFSIHPLSKKERYQCAKCHTPTDKELLNKCESSQKAMPKSDSKGQQEAILCSYCHRIKDIKEHAKMNQNIINDKKRYFYADDKNIEGVKEYSIKKGVFVSRSGSPYHTIDTTNELFKNGKVCLGCHSHKRNQKDFLICKTEFEDSSKENCITCHMPKVGGSFVNHIDTKTHRYHGFSGVFNTPEFLSKYIELSIKKDKFLTIKIKNRAPHNIFLHPMRVAALKVTITNKGKKIAEFEKRFLKIYGKNGKKAPLWEATEILKDTTLKAKESKNVTFEYIPKEKDVVKVEFGFYIINPVLAKKLDLKEFSDFKVLRTVIF